MANKILGRATVKVDGRTVLNKRGATLDIGGVQRTPVIGSQGVHGFSEEIQAPKLDLRITQDASFALEDIRKIENATILFQGDDGVSYVLNGAFSTSVPTLAEVDGEITASFSGTSCDRI